MLRAEKVSITMTKPAIMTVDSNPLHINGRKLRMSKAYTKQENSKPTILTDDVFTFISFFYSSHTKSMRFIQPANKAKYGDANQYSYIFYWQQAQSFYQAAKVLPIESSPVAAYYCMLNAAKSYIAYTSATADDFVEDFHMHGLCEATNMSGADLSSIGVAHYRKGVFPQFAQLIDSDFLTIWPEGKTNGLTLKSLLYNLPFVHRAFTMTYSTRDRKVAELFIPLVAGESPEYHKGSDGKAYLMVNLEPSAFAINASSVPASTLNTVSNHFVLYCNRGFTLMSKSGGKWTSSKSMTKELRDLNAQLRKDFCYIRSSKRLWYLRKSDPQLSDSFAVNPMTISMAVMHRISEIARYKPEQLSRLMKSKENWLLHEYISQSLDQFLDELASEITHQDIMCVGVKA